MTSTTQEDIAHKTGGHPIVERIAAACAYMTGGWSDGIALPIKRLLDRQIKQLYEVLLEEMRAGQIEEPAVIDEDHLVAFVLRIGRAAMEGAAKNKLKIMARYFFRNAASPDYSSGAMADFLSVTDQLTDADMRSLAVIKRARISNHFERSVAEGADALRIDREMTVGELFPSQRSFNLAAIALVRFGFIYMGSDWGGNIALSMTPRGFDYIDNLDLDCIDLSREADRP